MKLNKNTEKDLINDISKEINKIVEKYKNSNHFIEKNFWWNSPKDFVEKFPNWGNTEININTYFEEYVILSFSVAKILLGVNLIWILLKYIEVLNSCLKLEKRKPKSFFSFTDIYIENKDLEDARISFLEEIGKYSQKSKINILDIRHILTHPLKERSKNNRENIKYDKYWFYFDKKNKYFWIINGPRESKDLWLIINENELNRIFLSALEDILKMVLEISEI